jgi:hypothetical protein
LCKIGFHTTTDILDDFISNLNFTQHEHIRFHFCQQTSSRFIHFGAQYDAFIIIAITSVSRFQLIISLIFRLLSRFSVGLCHCEQKREQEDPCKTKVRVVGDATYCDRYWECVDGQPELYDCPNGLVFAGKNRGVTEGCDYPWRASYCVGKHTASKIRS